MSERDARESPACGRNPSADFAVRSARVSSASHPRRGALRWIVIGLFLAVDAHITHLFVESHPREQPSTRPEPLRQGAAAAPRPPRTVQRAEAPRVPASAPAIRREIRVRVACDEEYRWDTGTNWPEVARRELTLASVAFERQSGIRWLVVDVVPWESADAAPGFDELLDQLDGGVSRAGVDVVFGLSGQTRAKGAMHDYPNAGKARYFGPVAILRTWSPNPGEKWFVGAIVHELAHVLGAWHTDDTRFVTSWSGERQSQSAFDPVSVEAIELTRDIDFARGADWLDDSRRGQLAELFRKGHASNVVLPYAYTQLDLARRLPDTEAEVARAACRRAVAAHEAATSVNDRALVTCLRALARSCLRGPGLAVDEAAAATLRARDLAALEVANDDDPPLEDESLLAVVAWERGRRGEAVAKGRLVYQARLTALGAAHPATVRAKEAVERYGGR